MHRRSFPKFTHNAPEQESVHTCALSTTLVDSRKSNQGYGSKNERGNIFSGGQFCGCHVVRCSLPRCCRRSQSRKAAMWLGIGFGVASMSAICELLVAYAGPPKIWALGAFATVLCAW